ncbi:MAG TPA: hypothetical protein VHW64_15695 [Nocardioides sp.]|uniref:divisome protein SepX/GlpR n=1 Tax=Nocardioides sp. TaxID=35761 RepID=UPI002E32749A|nr:hypothetical protein [Nocardioides sp.]HEX3932147.1 hypothetical protein [Nocardioides sp.]
MSGLIFVALAVAWAAYLIPKALRHHDEAERSRSIDRFSHSMRVLARREPVNRRTARLVETQAGPAVSAPAARPTADEQYAARREATHRATRRRRRVLTVLVLALLGVVAAAGLRRIDLVFVAAPVVLLLGWLGACRVMVRRERRWRPAETTTSEHAADAPAPTAPAEAPTAEAAAPDPDLWDPVPVTLPTYVSKPPARRAVRTIDLDATGVWTSGRSESDTALAREADAAQAAERGLRRTTRTDPQNGEAVGS